jgi:hypothetical protein
MRKSGRRWVSIDRRRGSCCRWEKSDERKESRRVSCTPSRQSSTRLFLLLASKWVSGFLLLLLQTM